MEEKLLAMATRAMEAENSRLRADLEAEKALSRQLWLAVANLQYACGVAATVEYIHKDFTTALVRADEMLDGIVGLTPDDPTEN